MLENKHYAITKHRAMKKDVMILTGAGQIGMAIARRMGHGMKIIVGDKNLDNAAMVCDTMNKAGFDAEAVVMDLSSRESIKAMICKAASHGDISILVNAAGVSPSQASIETILKVDLYGPAGRPGTADEVANVAELLMDSRGAFITGSDFLMDGGATASYFYGPLRPKP